MQSRRALGQAFIRSTSTQAHTPLATDGKVSCLDKQCTEELDTSQISAPPFTTLQGLMTKTIQPWGEDWCKCVEVCYWLNAVKDVVVIHRLPHMHICANIIIIIFNVINLNWKFYAPHSAHKLIDKIWRSHTRILHALKHCPLPLPSHSCVGGSFRATTKPSQNGTLFSLETLTVVVPSQAKCMTWHQGLPRTSRKPCHEARRCVH